jgi:hypothetical protein
MTTSTNPKDIQNHFADIAATSTPPTTSQLVFDPTSGQLAVQTRGEAKPSPDAIVADQPLVDGFFA